MLVLCCSFLCAILLQATAFSQAGNSFNKHGISFSYPSGSTVKDDSEPGKYGQVHCTTPTGNFFSITAYETKMNPDSELKDFQDSFDKEYRTSGATNIKFNTQKTGWVMTFTLNKINFLCDANYYQSFKGHGRQVIIVRQYPIFNPGDTMPAELTNAVKSIDVK